MLHGHFFRGSTVQYILYYYNRTLVREMFVNYLSSQDKKKNEIARLIGKILDVPQQELNRVSVHYHALPYDLAKIS